MCWIILQRAFNPKLTKGREPTGDEIRIAWTLLKDPTLGLEQARLKATYVDILKETVVTPAAIPENRAREILKGVEVLVTKMQGTHRTSSLKRKDSNSECSTRLGQQKHGNLG